MLTFLRRISTWPNLPHTFLADFQSFEQPTFVTHHLPYPVNDELNLTFCRLLTLRVIFPLLVTFYEDLVPLKTYVCDVVLSPYTHWSISDSSTFTTKPSTTALGLNLFTDNHPRFFRILSSIWTAMDLPLPYICCAWQYLKSLQLLWLCGDFLPLPSFHTTWDSCSRKRPWQQLDSQSLLYNNLLIESELVFHPSWLYICRNLSQAQNSTGKLRQKKCSHLLLSCIDKLS